MHETLLLTTLERVIRGVEIGNQNAREVGEHIFEKRSFPGRLIEVVHLIHAGQHPDVAFVMSKSHCSFINVDEWASQDSFKDLRVNGLVQINNVALQPVQSVFVNRKPKDIPKSLSHSAHVQTASDVRVDAPAQQSVTVLLRKGRNVLGTELVVTFGAAVFPGHKASNPLFYSTLGEPQIKEIMAYWLALVDIFTSAPGTRPGLSAVHFVDTNQGSSKLPVLLVNKLEVRMRVYEDLLPLVIEVRAFGDLLEIFQSVLFRPK